MRKILIAIFVMATLQIPAQATPTDDWMYASAEEKRALQCMIRRNDVRRDLGDPISRDYYMVRCADEMKAYYEDSGRNHAEAEVQKMLDYFRADNNFK
jgi:hypothetical protein